MKPPRFVSTAFRPGCNFRGAARKMTPICLRCRQDHKKCRWPADGDKCDRCYKLGRICSGQQVLTPLPASSFSCDTSFSESVETPRTSNHQMSSYGQSSTVSSVQGSSSTTFEGCTESRASTNLTKCDADTLCKAAHAVLSRCKWDCETHFKRINPEIGSPKYSSLLSEDLAGYDTGHKRLEFMETNFVAKAGAIIQTLSDADKKLHELHNLNSIQSRGVLPTQAMLHLEGLSFRASAPTPNVEDVVSRCTESILLQGITRLGKSHIGEIIAHRRTASFQDYEQAAGLISRFIQQELANTASGCPLRNGIPAMHLAMLNKDPDIVERLWRDSLAHRYDVDLVGRKISHLLIEHREWELLKSLAWIEKQEFRKRQKRQKSQSKEMIPDAGQDARGMDLLSITATLGDEDNFTLLRNRGAVNFVGRHLINFALVGGKQDIVEEIVRSPSMVNQPYTRELRKAIELGRPDLAECFFNRADMCCVYTGEEVEELADMAKEHHADGMDQLVVNILNIDVNSSELPEVRKNIEHALVDVNRRKAHPEDSESGRRTWTNHMTHSYEEVAQSYQPYSPR